MPIYVPWYCKLTIISAKKPTSKDRYYGRPSRADCYILPVKIRAETLKWFNKRVFTALLNKNGKKFNQNALSLTELSNFLH